MLACWAVVCKRGGLCKLAGQWFVRGVHYVSLLGSGL